MNPDINGQLTALQLLTKRTVVATSTSNGIDVRDFINNAKIAIVHNEISTGGSLSVQYSILDSADNTTFAASSYLPTVAASTAASACIEIPIDTRNCKRYIQLRAAVTTPATATFDIGSVLVGLKQLS